MSRMGRVAQGLTLLVLPAVLAVVALRLDRDRGPWWLGSNSDPSYQYLLNSLLVRLGHPPCHVDHPGTPLQSLGAAVLQATTPGREGEVQMRAVLANPEAALARIHRTLLAGAVVALALAGWLVWARSGSWWLALGVQLTPLLQVGTYRSTLWVDPEALLVPLGVLLVALLVMGELGPEGADAPRRDRWLAPVLGLVAGVGLATKITFAPLCLLALLTRRTWREAGWTLGAMGAGTAGALAPAFSEVPRMLRWFERLATHTGTYGTGAEGFVDPTRYLSGIGSMVLADRVLLVLAVVAVVVGGAGGRWWGGEVVRARHRRLLLLTAGVQILGVLLVAKHPHPRYLVPVAISAAFNAVLLADLVRRVGPRPGGRWIRRGALGLGLVGTILVWSDGRELAQELRGVRDRQLSFVREVDDLAARGRHVDYYRSSSVAFALHFGNGTAWRLFAEPLAELHPGRLFFNRFTGRFETFAGPVPFDQVAGNAPLFLVGTGGIESPVPGGIGLPPPGWSLIAVRRSGEMTLHRLGPEKRPP